MTDLTNDTDEARSSGSEFNAGLGQWISVKDGLPNKNNIEGLTVGHSHAVLGYVTDNICMFTVSYDYERKLWRYFDDSHQIVRHEITHWMPLPQPPNV